MTKEFWERVRSTRIGERNCNFSLDVEFMRLFGDLFVEEVLIADYFCALDRRDFLHQGRLFVTSRHMCFYANISECMDTRVRLPWDLELDLITK
jgi:hypothetical protein